MFKFLIVYKKGVHNVIKQQDDDNYSIIDKNYLNAKDPYEANYQYLTKKHENNSLKNLKDPKALIEYSNNMQDDHKKSELYNPVTKNVMYY